MKTLILLVLFVFAFAVRVYAQPINVDIPSDGYHTLRVEFMPLAETSTPVSGAVYVGDAYLYVYFPQYFTYTNFPFLSDEHGNDRMPHRTQQLRPGAVYLHVYLGQGTWEVSARDERVELHSARVYESARVPTHDQYMAALPMAYTVNIDIITIEAQAMEVKSALTIVPSAMSGADISPSRPGVRLLNVIGLSGFDQPGDFADWYIYVEAEGFYYLTFRYMQNTNINLNSYRKISINGAVPFYEFMAVPFPYTTRWRNHTLDTPVFLQAGRNTLRLTVTSAPYDYLRGRLMETVGGIRTLDMTLRSVMGNDVDPFKLWDLESYVPDLSAQLITRAYELEEIMHGLHELTGFNISGYRALQSAASDLRRFAARPNDLARSAQALSQIIAPLTDWMIALETQPIILDRFYIHGSEVNVPRANSGIFARFLHAIRNFFASFRVAAGMETGVHGDGIQVWIMRSRDYVDLMQQMSTEFFTADTGIPVSVNFIPDTMVLILANAAGQLPELAGGMELRIPYEYAIRGALVDLTRFEGFSELAAPMAQGTLTPYRYLDGVFALPEEVIFSVLFYRRDILESMGLEVPSTWDDVLAIIPQLNRVGANFFFPYGDFQTFFAQMGVEVYTPDGLDLLANSEEGFEAFRFWTDLYVKYGLPARMESFYQHFRMGTAPIGVAPVHEYIRFELTAPDIAGEWGVAPIPGTIEADGFINRSQGGIQNGMMMFRTTPQREDDAWQFMQWWLSTSTQVLFAQNLENFYGPEFRWYTANLDALTQLGWRPSTRDVFHTQLGWHSPIPFVPGGYMTLREIWNAWTRVVIRHQHYREELEIAFRDIRMEMERKQLEFGIIDSDGNVLRTLDVQHFDAAAQFR
ncbi:MAG: extracellular solute-binding protein [Defluviitaleaceae bacterium]|nr:extracellular solute-binding protein [Defluviitaleaceae bacterium]